MPPPVSVRSTSLVEAVTCVAKAAASHCSECSGVEQPHTYDNQSGHPCRCRVKYNTPYARRFCQATERCKRRDGGEDRGAEEVTVMGQGKAKNHHVRFWKEPSRTRERLFLSARVSFLRTRRNAVWSSCIEEAHKDYGARQNMDPKREAGEQAKPHWEKTVPRVRVPARM